MRTNGHVTEARYPNGARKGWYKIRFGDEFQKVTFDDKDRVAWQGNVKRDRDNEEKWIGTVQSMESFMAKEKPTVVGTFNSPEEAKKACDKRMVMKENTDQGLRKRGYMVEGYGQLEMDPIMKAGAAKSFDDPSVDKEVESLKPYAKEMLDYLNKHSKSHMRGKWKIDRVVKTQTIEFPDTFCAAARFYAQDSQAGQYKYWEIDVYSPVGLNVVRVSEVPTWVGSRRTGLGNFKKGDLGDPKKLFLGSGVIQSMNEPVNPLRTRKRR